MSELKFRVWDKFSGEDVEGAFVGEMKEWDPYRTGVYYKSPYYDLLQYTGVNDKNSTPIYEGDLLAVTGTETILTVINMNEFLLFCGEYSGKNGIDLSPLLMVIGNVYEGKKDETN